MIAIISDIHSNTEALSAVLADIAERGAKQIFCLGDIVGYGPSPRECLDLIMANCSATLMGNHDCAVMFEPANFNMGAESACYWTRGQLEGEPDIAKRTKRWEFLGKLPVKYIFSAEDLGMRDVWLAHGSPRRPINEYVFPDDIYNSPSKMKTLFDRISHLCFIGHTHVPGVFLNTPDFYSPDELEGVFEVDPDRKAIINVGSVGQPRDRDCRASYVMLEPGLVRFVRVEYDVNTVADKVSAIAELDNYLGARLMDGR